MEPVVLLGRNSTVVNDMLWEIVTKNGNLLTKIMSIESVTFP